MSRCSSLLAGSVVAGVMVVAPLPLQAAPCADFTDVEDTSPFCANVTWVKNRAITLGCTSSTLYCPADPVGRLAMAAFLNRLGTALTPTLLYDDGGNFGLDTFACPVTLPAAGYTRRAHAIASMSAQFDISTSYTVRIYYSTDGGANWINLNGATVHRATTVAGGWAAASQQAVLDLQPNVEYRFSTTYSLLSGAPEPGGTSDRCTLTVRVDNRG